MAILRIIPVTAIIVIIAPNPPLGHGLEKLQCHSPVAAPDACADCTAEAYNGGCLLRSLAGKYSQQKQGPILKRYVAWFRILSQRCNYIVQFAHRNWLGVSSGARG